jgi:glutamine phosphoribosylpyrophosphate amidotransferase
MCSLIGSFSAEKFKELIDINQFRGTFSYSYFNTNTAKIQKDFGAYNYSIVEFDGFKIGHVQAPTGGLIKDTNRIHPTEIHSSLLWHNGIITSRGIKFLQELTNSTETFDTLLLHKAIHQEGFKILSKIEGLFTCVFYFENNYYVFRSKHGKLYVDDDLNFSSEKFENSKCINFDTVYMLDFNEKKLIICDSFETLRYNVVIDGEI